MKSNMSNKISSLDDLQSRKEELKNDLSKGFENPFDNVKKLLGQFASDGQNPLALFDKPQEGRNQLMDEGVKALLTIAASAVVSRFKLGPVPKLILTTSVAFVTPYVVDKIQDLLYDDE